MSKSIKTKWKDALTFEKLILAYERTSITKKNKKEAIQFSIDLETNIGNLYKQLKTGSYKIGKYREFIIYEPKKRVIRALPYRDRIVHQWYVGEFIKPFFVSRFIKDTYACIDGRGSHKAVDTLQKYMRIMKRRNPNYYILKCDVKNYFYTIKKDILFSIMSRSIREKELLDFTYQMIYEDKKDEIGISIGNYTSQYFANIYLNELDHFVKEELKVTYYVRYMDDFILLLDTKEESKRMKEVLTRYVKEHLALDLNKKTNYYPNKMGVNFCGYQVFNDYRLLKSANKRKIQKKIRKWNQMYLENPSDELLVKISASWNAWLAHSSHANCFTLQNKLYNTLIMKEFLMSPQEFEKRQIDKQEMEKIG